MSDTQGMTKVFFTFKRREGLTLEEFSDYWLHHHGPIVARLFPNLRKYVQNHWLASLPADGPIVDRTGGADVLQRSPDIDGVVELYFDDLQSWLGAYDRYLSPAAEEVREDEVKFFDHSKTRFFISQPVVIKDVTQSA